LWRAAEALPDPLCDLARTVLALPVRRGEAAQMDWADVDLRGATWTLPARITKNGDPHRMALPPLILAILERRHAEAGAPAAGLVFPSQIKGGVVARWSWMRAVLVASTGFAAWSWHDVRRSFASILAERQVPEAVADAVLNHRQSGTRGGVLGVYQLASRWPEQRQAVEAWCRLLADAIEAEGAGDA
jgi:integrase